MPINAMAAAIEKGECDRTRYILKPSLLMDLKKVKNVVAKGYPNHGFYTLSYHTRRPPLDDPAFRRAIDLVIPRELMIEAINAGDSSGFYELVRRYQRTLYGFGLRMCGHREDAGTAAVVDDFFVLSAVFIQPL